ncbi:MAG: hypothetical protein ABSG95_01540 [Solirubrobacteraceae bacterium]
MSKLSVYLQPTGSSGQERFQGVIYADSSGTAGALLGTSSAISLTSTNSAGWYELPLPTALELAAGNYWLGFMSGGSAGVAAFRYDSVASSLEYNANTFTSGPSNPFGSPTIISDQISLYATYTPTAPAGSRPSNTAPPTISGVTQTGQTLSAGMGSWTESPSSYAYQWLRCNSGGAGCSAITGASEHTYALGSPDLGSTLRVEVTASNSQGHSEPALSEATAVVSAGGAGNATYYVSEDGEEATANGSLEKPWRTINRVNAGLNGVNGAFPAGSTILFEAGYRPPVQGEYLKGNSGGTAGAPITYSIYGGTTKADVGDIYVEGYNYLTFRNFSLIGNAKTFKENAAGGKHANNITIEDSEIKDWKAGIEVAYGNSWHIIGNTIEETADSGILTQTDAEVAPGKEENPPGENWVIDNNIVNRTDLVRNVCGTAAHFCHEHGIYFRCRNSELVGNTVTNFGASGISQRFGNDTIARNKISKGGEGDETGSQGIQFFPFDNKESTSRWIENEISDVPVGMYVAYYDEGSGDKYLKEHFIIDDNRFIGVTDPATNETELLDLIAEGRPEFLKEHTGNTFE